MNTPKKLNFTSTIESLENRASRSARTVRWIGIALAVIVLYAASTIIYILLLDKTTPDNLKYLFANKTLESTLDERGANLVNNLISTESNKGAINQKEQADKLREVVVLLNSLSSSRLDASTTQPSITNSISTVAFSLGAVGFIVLLIQIAVQFMRYYARLAELYQAQADSLKASDGDPSVAYQFMEHFSPMRIEIGNAPATVYEKALDTITSVANKNK